MFKTLISLLPLAQARKLLVASALGLMACATTTLAHAAIDPMGNPNDFVLAVGTEALDAIKADQSIKSGDMSKINQVVNDHVLPYTNLEKTTRLAAGRYWRQATPEQQKRLVQAFTGTLIRTYSGAFTKVDQYSALSMQPFRGDANANDVVVRSTLTQRNSPSVNIDYRLEKTPQGWKIYDLNVEGIWLIQNYRNQFAQQISQNGVDGLINALNQRNQ
ncbi:MAG: ABC transporter substrate-binding protein [Burkholderiaceae bacterium]|nr:ABC transporter substrate-binding protein [Burkholderiaceae bacterium]